MSYLKHNSWGRTRRPKNIAGPDGTAVTAVASLGDAKNITDAVGATVASKAVPASGVYSTENQRFLHLSCISGGSVSNVWVYHYASGVWSELVTSAAASIAVAASNCEIVEIAGADLVALHIGGTVYAACSTF